MDEWRRSSDSLSLDEHLALSQRATRERWLTRRWSVRLLAFAPFVVVLLLVRILFPIHTWLWNSLVYASLAWGIVICVYALLLLLGFVGVRCPRCAHRYGSGEECSGCGLPRHS